MTIIKLNRIHETMVFNIVPKAEWDCDPQEKEKTQVSPHGLPGPVFGDTSLIKVQWAGIEWDKEPLSHWTKRAEKRVWDSWSSYNLQGWIWRWGSCMGRDRKSVWDHLALTRWYEPLKVWEWDRDTGHQAVLGNFGVLAPRGEKPHQTLRHLSVTSEMPQQ